MTKRRTRTTSTALACMLAVTSLAACASDESTDSTQSTVESATESGDTVTVAPPESPSLSSVSGAGGFPVTVETCGRDVTIDNTPSAVVTGWPTIIDTLNALGVGDAVIGYTSADFATAPATNAEAIAPDFRTSREVMIDTGLDMFIVNDENQIDASEGNLGWDDLETLDASAYVLGGYCLDGPAPTGLDVVYNDIDNLGRIFGVTDRASELNNELAERVTTAATNLGSLAGSKVAVVQVFDGTLYALSGSYYAMIPEALAMESVFADLDANFAEISPEEVLTLSPDVVVVVHEGGAAEADAAVSEISTLLAAAPAVTGNRIATVQNGQLSGGGVSVINVIESVADQLM